MAGIRTDVSALPTKNVCRPGLPGDKNVRVPWSSLKQPAIHSGQKKPNWTYLPFRSPHYDGICRLSPSQNKGRAMSRSWQSVALAMSLAFFATGACDVSGNRTSFSSVGYAQMTDGESVSPMTAYTGARLFSEDNQDYRFRALGCEFDVRYTLDSSEMDQLALQFFLGAQDAAAQGSPMSPSFGARLVNGRPTGADALGRSISCDTTTATVAFVLARLQTPEGSVPVAGLWSNRDNRVHVFRMQTDQFTPAQEQRAIEMAGDFGVALVRSWVTRGR